MYLMSICVIGLRSPCQGRQPVPAQSPALSVLSLTKTPGGPWPRGLLLEPPCLSVPWVCDEAGDPGPLWGCWPVVISFWTHGELSHPPGGETFPILHMHSKRRQLSAWFGLQPGEPWEGWDTGGTHTGVHGSVHCPATQGSRVSVLGLRELTH